MRRFRLHTRTTLVGFLGLVVVFVPYAKSATAAPLSARAESGTFTETFSSTTYRDATTTADWNTALGLLQEQITTDGSVFNADKITTGPEQITNNSGDSTTQSAYSVAFDSQDRPNIVWSDDSSGNYEIYYSRWEPSKQKWEKANSDAGYDNVSNNEGISRYPVLRIKSNDRPVIAWEDHTDQIEGVVYREYSPSTGWATLKGTGGVEVPISTATGTFPNMVLDSLDRPHIAFLENPSKDPNNVYYKYWTGSAWAVHAGSANVSDNTTSSSAAPHIALNSKDEPTIAWQDRNPDRDIFLVVANTLANTWQDVAGNTYSDACIATTCRDTNVTQTSTLTDWPDLALDASGDPYLVYQDVPVTTAESFFTRWDPTSGPSGRWVSMDDTPGKDQLTNNGATTLLPRIALGPSDVPYITFSNAGGGTGVVYAIKWDGASWTSLDENDTGPSIELTKISDHDTVASTRQSIAVDSQGQPAFVWTDFASPDHEIYFGWWLNHYAKSGLAVSKSVATTTEQIRS
ncbi:MAG: hypothetical protein Q8P33_01220, partial [bacterium]|nr:hypothetical protein [bacterium]